MSYKKVKIKAISSIVAQFRENSEIEVIMCDGIMYVPHYQVTGGDEEDDGEKAVKAPKAETKKPAKEKVSKKEEEEEDEEVEKPAKKSKGSSDVKSKVEEIVTDFDSGDLIQSKAVTKLVDLTGKSNKEVNKILTAFSDDDDAEISSCVKKLMAKTDDEDEEEETEKPAKSKKAAVSKKGKKENLVDVEDLKKGDRVSVYWGTDPEDETEYNKWYDGTVTSTKGGVSFEWDDETESDYDAELMEKIKMLEEEED